MKPPKGGTATITHLPKKDRRQMLPPIHGQLPSLTSRIVPRIVPEGDEVHGFLVFLPSQRDGEANDETPEIEVKASFGGGGGRRSGPRKYTQNWFLRTMSLHSSLPFPSLPFLQSDLYLSIPHFSSCYISPCGCSWPNRRADLGSNVTEISTSMSTRNV